MEKKYNPTYMTAKEIAEQLGVLSSTKKPHARIVADIMHRLDIRKVYKDHRMLYPADCKPKIREWFHQEGMPEEIMDRNGKINQVYYVPCKGGKPDDETAV